jgi:hypothetical protein
MFCVVLPVWCMGGMAVACKNDISSSIFGVWVAWRSFIHFWRMGGMAVACKNGIIPCVLSYGWHGGSDVLIGPFFWCMGGMEVAYKNGMTLVEVWSWAFDGYFVRRRTGRLTGGRNITLDSSSSCLRGNEYKRKAWRHCWGQCFLFAPPLTYGSRDSRLTLQGVEADSNHHHNSPVSRKKRWRGDPVPGGLTGQSCSWRI